MSSKPHFEAEFNMSKTVYYTLCEPFYTQLNMINECVNNKAVVWDLGNFEINCEQRLERKYGELR